MSPFKNCEKGSSKIYLILLILVILGGGAFLVTSFLGGGEPAEVSTVVSVIKPIPGRKPPAKTAKVPAKPAAVKPGAPDKAPGKVATKPEPAVEKKPTPAKPAPVKVAAVKPKPKPTASKPAPTKTTTTKVSAAAKPWAIHVASFNTSTAAKSFEKRLDRGGYNAYVTHFKKDGVDWYRVRVGFYSTREKARKNGVVIEKKYDKSGLWIVKPAKSEVARHSR